MRFHFATVPVHSSAEVERELNVFLGSHRVLGVERHLVADGAQSVWAICVSYTDTTSHHAASHDLSRPSRSGPGRKELLGAAEFAKFARLRECRALTASECAVERSPELQLSGSRTWP